MIKNNNTKSGFPKGWFYPLIIVVWILIFTYWKRYLRSIPQDYTVGTITRIYLPPKGNRLVVFDYSVHGKSFSHSIPFSEFSSKPEVGLNFVVEYPEGLGGRFGMLLPNLAVGDTVDLPLDGWNEIPKPILR